jgi:hypothetical protein
MWCQQPFFDQHANNTGHWRAEKLPVAQQRDLGPADALSVGMFLQTLLLALIERGLGSCVEVSISGYPEIVRAAGYPHGTVDPVRPGNRLSRSRISRK